MRRVCFGALAVVAAGCLAGLPAPAAVALPGAAASGSASVAAVACPSAVRCVAVGRYGFSATGTGGQGLLLIRHGSSWKARPAPAPAGASSVDLLQIACASAATCVAAGTYTDSAGTQQELLLTGHGTSWTAVEAPLPPGAGGNPLPSISSVACPTAATCVVAGSYEDSAFHEQGLLLTGLGPTWTAVTAPVPPDADTDPVLQVTGLACPTATACVAVGSYASAAAGNDAALLLTGFGSTWHTSEVPLPPDADPSLGTFLTAVTCPTAATCVATGGYAELAGGTESSENMLLTGHGSSWTVARAPWPADAGHPGGLTELDQVSCSSVTTCLATGFYTGKSPGDPGLLVTARGQSWTAVTAPLPPRPPTATLVSLSAVVCVSASQCIAVGDYNSHLTHSPLYSLLLTGYGSKWTSVNAPVPANASATPDAQLQGVACPTTATCVAVGDYADPAGHDDGLLLTGRKATWTATEAPLPPMPGS
jgi:hypothetical protein